MFKGPVRFLPGLLSSSSSSSSRGEKRHDGKKDDIKPNHTNDKGKKAVLRLPYSSQHPPIFKHQRQPPSSSQKLSTTLAQIHRQQLLHQQQQHLSHNAAHVLYTGRRQDHINRSNNNDDDDDDDDSTSNNVLPYQEGYALEFDCGESVSSLNDSCFGGASVTGGYNIYSSTTDTEQQQSPMKQATSLAVGVVPSISVLSVSDHPSFDTEDISYYVHDIEQPPMLSLSSSSPPPPQTSPTPQVEENSLINSKDGRLRTMKPMLTGTLSPKQKRNRSNKTHRESHSQNNNDNSKLRIVPSRTTMATSDSTGNINMTPSTGSSNPIKVLPIKDASSFLMISTTSSESHHESSHIVETTTLPPTTSTTTTSINQQHCKKCVCIRGCHFPQWLQRVPFWLKVLLFIGWMILLVAVLIAMVGGIVSSVQKNTTTTTNQNDAESLFNNDNHHPFNYNNDTINVIPTSNIFSTSNNNNNNNTVSPTTVIAAPTISPTISRHKSDKENKTHRRSQW